MDNHQIFDSHFDLNNVKSYSKYTGTAFRNGIHKNTMYYGCIFENCDFSDNEMKSDDIIGCLYSNCILNNFDLSNTDFSTNKLTNTKLNNVSFDGSTITNCDFGKCVFDYCSFSHISLNNNVFRNCIFTNVDLVLTTTCNNQFIDCTFTNCNLKNSVNYNIFSQCKFTNTNIDANVYISNIYDSIYPEHIPFISDGEPNEIKQRLKDTSQYIHYAICKFNIGSITLDTAFYMGVMAIQTCFKNNLIIRVEQIIFVDSLLKYSIATNKNISALTLYQCINVLEPLLSENVKLTEMYVQSVCVAIKQLYLDCCEQYTFQSNKINLEFDQFENSTDKLYLDIIYEKKPEYNLTTLLNEIADSTNVKDAKAICVLSEYACYHEIIEIFGKMKPILDVLIALIGLLVPFSIERLHKKNQNSPINNTADKTTNNNYTINNIIQINNIYLVKDSNEINSIAEILVERNITSINKYCGYNNDNVRSITIQDDFHQNK